MYNLVSAEVLKQSRSVFLRVALLVPLGFSLTVLVVLLAGKFFGVAYGNLADTAIPGGPDVGKGVFGFGATVVMLGIGQIYTIGLVAIAGQVIQGEFNWSTIKMLAIREPSRTRLILAKAAFMALYILALAVVIFISWIIYSFGLKFVYNLPFDFNDDDATAFGKGLRQLGGVMFICLVWSLLGMAMAVRFKSLIATIIAYVIYSTLDGLLSSIGARAINGDLGSDFPGWLEPLINIAKFVCPFTINTNYARLVLAPGNPARVASISSIQAVLVMLVWAGLFTLLAARIFTTRDITD